MNGHTLFVYDFRNHIGTYQATRCIFNSVGESQRAFVERAAGRIGAHENGAGRTGAIILKQIPLTAGKAKRNAAERSHPGS